MIACPDCDLLQHEVAVPERGAAHCSRCGARLYRNLPDSIPRTLAYIFAADVAFIMANCFPVFTLQAAGETVSTTLLGAVSTMWQQGMQVLALLIFYAAFLAPALRFGITSYTLLHVLSGRGLHLTRVPLRFLDAARPWAMVEVFMLGVLVAVVKIMAYASVKPGIGLWSFAAVVVLQALASSSYEPGEVWRRIDFARHEAAAEMMPQAEARLGLLSCGVCGLLSRPAPGRVKSDCPRCGEPLHFRKPESITRTWAFLIAAGIFYIPANAFPVMTTSTAFGGESDTILGGVVLLWTTGSWPLAMVVFIASFMVPLGKLVGLSFLLISVKRRAKWLTRWRTKLYRMIDFIGRWSMLDMFVVTLVVGMVQMQPLMWVNPERGAVFFGAVVVLTMLAAQSFDPRLIWDAAEDDNV